MRPIQSREYYHDLDRKALEALKAIPGFTAALKAFMKMFNERMIHGLNMASKIRLGPRQLPEIHAYLPPICAALGIDEPELYLEMNPAPNAFTYGDSQASITVTSGLLEYMDEDEVKAVLAHECGHIACHHVLYHTMASMILQGGGELLGLGALTLPLQLALFHWERCSEFSCDRAAAVYMQGCDSVVETMIRLAGGKKDLTGQINKDLYLEQADEYMQTVGESALNKTLQYLVLMNRSHPFLSVRAVEIKKWCDTEQFSRLLAFANGEADEQCPQCGTEIEEGWNFCKKCGAKI